MNKFMISVAILLCTSSVTGCKKANDKFDVQKTVTANIKNSESYQYEVGYIGKDDRLTISLSPKHAEVSELRREGNGKAIYHYKPAGDYVGRDEVELTWAISNGAVVLRADKTKLLIRVTP
jgi:hypothetical protein